MAADRVSLMPSKYEKNLGHQRWAAERRANADLYGTRLKRRAQALAAYQEKAKDPEFFARRRAYAAEYRRRRGSQPVTAPRGGRGWYTVQHVGEHG